MKQISFKKKEFSKAVSTKRKQEGKSVRGFKELDISASTISRLENENTPDLVTYAKMCKWLCVPFDQFFK